MTELAETLSTTLDQHAETAASGAGEPVIPADEAKPDPKPESVRDAVSAAMKEEAPEPDKPDTEADADKGEKEKGQDEKAAEDKKPRAPDGKFAGKEKADEPNDKPELSGHAKQIEQGVMSAPKHFLPDAKEKWANTPQPVRREIETMLRTHETEATRYREAAERYEPIRQFDEIARQSGRAGVHESLAEVAQLEDLMGKNPLAALNQILLRAGPRKADGQPVSLFELAQTVVQMGQQGYQQAVTRQAQQQAPENDNPRIQQLEQTIASMQAQQLAANVIEPFKAAHPRYEELQGDIALFLKSGKIPTSLSAQERLEAAYDMAARINPASHDPASDPARPDPDRSVDTPPAAKSIKSAPGSVSDDMEPERGGSIKELLADEMKRQRRA